MKKLLLLCLLLSAGAFAQSGCPRSAPSYSVNISSATTTEIVAAQPGKKIYVIAFVLEDNHATTDVTVTLKSGTTALNGAGQLIKAAGGSWSHDCSKPAFVTAAGSAFNLTTDAAGTLSGIIWYVYD